MTGGQERRTKCRHDPADVHMADADEGGSSQPRVTGGRILRPRGQKRATTDDIVEGGNDSTSSDDDVEDEAYRIERRHWKGLVQEESEEEEEEEEGDEKEDDEAEEKSAKAAVPVVFRPRYAYGTTPTNYYGDGMIETVKRLRGENPYAEERTARDFRF